MKMKSVLVVVLLASSVYSCVSQRDTFDSDIGERYDSRILIQLAGDLGCAFNCTYRPKNLAQLPACLATKYLGADIGKLSTCGVVRDEATCGTTAESAGTAAANCFWIALTSSLHLAPGVCVPRILADYKDETLGVLLAFKPMLEHRVEEVDVIMGCLGKTGSDCGGDACQLCEAIPPKNYPMSPEFTEVCIPKSWHEKTCPWLRTPVEKHHDLCPLAKGAAKLECYKKLCPLTPAATPPKYKTAKTGNSGSPFIVHTL